MEQKLYFTLECIFSARDWEYSDGQTTCVAGRLAKNLDFWKSVLHASPFVLEVVENGYSIPFSSLPPPFFADNNRSSKRNRDFVDDAIKQLLLNKCIEVSPEQPYCCNPLTVAGGEKPRLVLDLRHVNKYINLSKFKYEDLLTFAEMFEKDDYFIRFDLRSGYHHISINSDFTKYLGFRWTFRDGSSSFFIFLVLPFGLSSACHVFTTVMRTHITKWRGEGIKKA